MAAQNYFNTSDTLEHH